MALRATTLPEPVLRWAADQVAVDARVVAGKGLRAGGSPWWLVIRHGGETTQVVLRIGDPTHPEGIATEAAALALADDHKLPAARASWTSSVPTPPAAASTRAPLPASQLGRADQQHRRAPVRQQRDRCVEPEPPASTMVEVKWRLPPADPGSRRAGQLLEAELAK